jgi:hypothetical protein
MKPDTSPLVSKLTLLVLILILACLVLLVVRSYQKGSPLHEVAAIETESPAPLEPAPVAITPVAAPPVRRTAEMPVASKPITKPSPTNPPGEAPAESSVPRTIGIVRSGPTDHRPPVVHETLAANGSALLAGMVTLKGTPKPEIPIELGPTCGALQPKPVTTRHYVVGPKGELANVVVYIKSGLQRQFGPVQPGPLIDQVGCMFEPYVSAVVAGQTFQVRNSDSTLHNVHTTPKVPGNREFNVGQPLKGQVNTFSFPVPEMNLRIKCDVHPWMFTYISVFDHPYFAITDTNGFFQLPAQIPAGKYIIGAAHLKTMISGELIQEVTLREGEQRSIQFEFTVP